MKELRAIAVTELPAEFSKQVGAFVLIQRPPDPVVEKMAVELGAGITAAAPLTHLSDDILNLLFEFDDLVVAALPPIQSSDEFTVGRLPDNDLVIDDPSVSKRHAVIQWDASTLRAHIEDQGSSNGTYLNGRPVMPGGMPVRDGDLVRFGQTQFLFVHGSTLHEKLSGIVFRRRPPKLPKR
jgi:FHA domain-containing protein